MISKVNWPLGNRESLEFEVYDRNDTWNDVPGLYIFSYVAEGYWRALYVGQAESFRARLPNHERLPEAVQRGATHIHAMVVPQQSDRDEWERMLIQNLQPPMNVQHRNVSNK
jgi:excinuclease UvrABC nuclease subunit